jgi:hypothetical protein
LGGRGGEDGDALIGAVVGFAVFMLLVLFAAQVITRLYATTVLTAAATRAAETVALSPVPAAAEVSAEAEARSEVASFAAHHVQFAWEEADGDQVVLHVDASSPAFLPGPSSWRRISRTVTIRSERFR